MNRTDVLSARLLWKSELNFNEPKTRPYNTFYDIPPCMKVYEMTMSETYGEAEQAHFICCTSIQI